MSAGNERPWTTRDTRMTAKVRKMTSSRLGDASPASVVSGSASAAASETAPRIPDHPRTIDAWPGLGIGLVFLRAQAVRYVPGTTQRKRAATTASATAAA